MTSNIEKFILFFKANQIITPTSQWHNNKNGIGHSITLTIKSASCTVRTVAKFILEVCISVNLAYVKWIQHKAAHLSTVNFQTQLAKFSTKIFAHLRDIVIFVSQYFLVHPAYVAVLFGSPCIWRYVISFTMQKISECSSLDLLTVADVNYVNVSLVKFTS